MKKINTLLTIIAISEMIFGMEQTHKSLLFSNYCKNLSILSHAMLRTGGKAVVTHAKLHTKSGESVIGKKSIAINQADQNHINNKLKTLCSRDTNK